MARRGGRRPGSRGRSGGGRRWRGIGSTSRARWSDARRRLVLLTVFCLVILALVLLFSAMTPADAGTRGPTSAQSAGAPQSVGHVAMPAQEIPRGCPGGPRGPLEEGTVCPDNDSTSRPERPPRGCPGGPRGPLQPGSECPDIELSRETMHDVAGCYGGPPGRPESGTICPDGLPPVDPELVEALGDWVNLDQEISHDLEAYDIGCDEGDAADFMRKMWCAAQAMPFAVGKWVVGIGTGIMDWALDFEVAETLTPMAGVLSRTYEVSVLGPINLVHLAWTVTLFIGGWSLMSGRTANGVREIFTTFLIAILGGMVLANPSGYLEGAQELARNTSGLVLEAVDGAMTGDSNQDSSEVRDRLSGILQRAFVDEPYDIINWGEPLRGDCVNARNQILNEGPHGSDDRPREIMRAWGCDEQADFNATPSDNRAIGSFTVALAAVLIVLLLISLALGVFAAQITLVILFSAASIVWLVALFPGGRSLLWMWISRLVWAVLVTVTAMFLLSWVAITTTVVLDNTSDISIIQRSVIVIVIAAVAYKFRGAIDRGLEGASVRMAASMGWAASATPPPGPAAPGTPDKGASGIATSPVAVGAAAGVAGLGGLQRVRHGGQRVVHVAGTTGKAGLQAGEATDRGVRTVANRTAGVGRTAIMAPVVLPQRFAQRQVDRQQRRTARSSQTRERLDQARQTRRQWARNVAHPLRATRSAREGIQKPSGGDTHDWI